MRHSSKVIGERRPFGVACKCGWVRDDFADYLSAKNAGYRHVMQSTSDRPWKIGHESTQIADATGQLIGSMVDSGDVALVVDAVNRVAELEGLLVIIRVHVADFNAKRTDHPVPLDRIERALSEVTPPTLTAIQADEVYWINHRLRLLREASRSAEPLEDREAFNNRWVSGERAQPSAQGHILSAITKLERRRAELLGAKR